VAEMSDLRQSEHRSSVQVDNAVTELRIGIAEMKEEINQQRSHSQNQANVLISHEERLNGIETTCRNIAAAITRGGNLQQIFQQITDSHFERVNRLLAGFETEVRFAIQETKENVTQASEHARVATSLAGKAEMLLGSMEESSEHLRLAAEQLAASMLERERALGEQTKRAGEFFESLRNLEKESRQMVEHATRLAGLFEFYKQRAGWGRFLGRLRWLIVGTTSDCLPKD